MDNNSQTTLQSPILNTTTHDGSNQLIFRGKIFDQTQDIEQNSTEIDPQLNPEKGTKEPQKNKIPDQDSIIDELEAFGMKPQLEEAYGSQKQYYLSQEFERCKTRKHEELTIFPQLVESVNFQEEFFEKDSNLDQLKLENRQTEAMTVVTSRKRIRVVEIQKKII